MRQDDLYSEGGTAVMDALEEERARTPARVARRRAAAVRAEEVDDEPEVFEERGRRGGVRLRLRTALMPESRWGRILAASVAVILLGAAVVGVVEARRFLLHDERFTIASSESIEIEGNRHLNRAQLLSIFGEDVERNIFTVSLRERRAELERLPWVAHATVMRLLPNHMRVQIVERVPVAFVREGGKIGMVDASGVVLDMTPDEMGGTKYSFPVVSGISAGDPMSTRTARMKIYAAFMKEMDSSGEKISEKLSEVDLTNPEDVKALIPEGTSDILVHFGDTDYLQRYRKFESHLAEWRTQYPKLASADMRYERQVVLEMQPGTSTAPAGEPAASDAPVGEASQMDAGTDAGTATHVPEARHAAPAKSAAAKVVAGRGRVLKAQQKAKKPAAPKRSNPGTE